MAGCPSPAIYASFECIPGKTSAARLCAAHIAPAPDILHGSYLVSEQSPASSHTCAYPAQWAVPQTGAVCPPEIQLVLVTKGIMDFQFTGMSWVGSALDLGSRVREFEPRIPDHFDWIR